MNNIFYPFWKMKFRSVFRNMLEKGDKEKNFQRSDIKIGLSLTLMKQGISVLDSIKHYVLSTYCNIE